jgi:tRNA (guanosine-2'-O-)-methyltransferase
MTRDKTADHQRALDARQPDLTVLMDLVTKPHNVSSIIRTADAVGIQQVHTTSTGELARRNYVGLGGAKHWVAVTAHRSTRAALTALRADGWRLAAAYNGEKSRDYRDIDYTQKLAIIVGGEHVGVKDIVRAEADDHIAVPMRGHGSSLTVSVVAGIILLEAERQRRAAGLYDESRLTPEERARTLFEWSYPDIAERCRAQGKPYPELTADGMIAANPLIDISTVSPQE